MNRRSVDDNSRALSHSSIVKPLKWLWLPNELLSIFFCVSFNLENYVRLLKGTIKTLCRRLLKWDCFIFGNESFRCIHKMLKRKISTIFFVETCLQSEFYFRINKKVPINPSISISSAQWPDKSYLKLNKL